MGGGQAAALQCDVRQGQSPGGVQAGVRHTHATARWGLVPGPPEPIQQGHVSRQLSRYDGRKEGRKCFI